MEKDYCQIDKSSLLRFVVKKPDYNTPDFSNQCISQINNLLVTKYHIR